MMYIPVFYEIYMLRKLLKSIAKKTEKLESTKRVSPAVASLGPEELALYELIGDEATGADELIHKSALPPGRVLALLSLMEMRRVVKRTPGPSFSRY